MPPTPPTQIGRYRIERELGRGAMGIVYEAEDTALGRRVALKTFGTMDAIAPTERQGFERRFLSEARISATIEDKNVVVVYDVGRDAKSGLLFMALEYVRGETLADVLARGPMPWKDAASVIAKIARALHSAHAQHIVHRDIKPANIMLNTLGEPKLMDFGIAKASASQLTLAGQVFGTPAYMAPEQASGEEVDGRSDIFSLGAVLYELVTNTRPFEGPTIAATLSRILRDDPRPASGLVNTPRALDGILERAMQKSRDARYQSAAQLAADLEGLVNGSAPPLEATRNIGPPARKSAAERADGNRRAASLPGTPSKATSLYAAGAIGVVVLAVVLIMFLRSRPETGPAASLAAAPEPTAAEAPPIAQTPAPASALGAPAPPVAAPTQSTAVLSVSGAARAVDVGLELRHPFASGTLRVKVDDGVIYADRISGMPIRASGVTTGYDGRFRAELKIPSGNRLVTVEVRSGSAEFVESIRVRVESGDNRRLLAIVGTGLTLTYE